VSASPEMVLFQGRTRPVLDHLTHQLLQAGVPAERIYVYIMANESEPDKYHAGAIDIEAVDPDKRKKLGAAPIKGFDELLDSTPMPGAVNVLYVWGSEYCIASAFLGDSDHNEHHVVDFSPSPQRPSNAMMRLVNAIYDPMCTKVRDEILTRGRAPADFVLAVDATDRKATIVLAPASAFAAFLTNKNDATDVEREIIDCVDNAPTHPTTIRGFFALGDEWAVGIVTLPASLISTSQGGTS
jgi:hypothetical protein